MLRNRAGTLLICVALACDDNGGVSPGTGDANVDSKPGETGATIDGAIDPASFDCPEVPTAYVFDHPDVWTGVEGAAQLLMQAGFTVQPLPLDENPATLQGLIFFGSFASESLLYRQYASVNAANLYTFVDKANVLLQMTQADQTEAIPPFLPSTHTARRHDQDLLKLYVVNPDNPLLAGIETKDNHLVWEGSPLGWETFVTQGGFEVTLAEDATAKNGAMIEGAYGQGRLILTGMAFDKPLGSAAGTVPFPSPIGDPAARDQFNQQFFGNLYQHVRNVCRRQTVALKITGAPPLPTFASDSFILTVLPDTQVYSLLYPGIFNAQTGWIAANARTRRIPYVMHVGDIVNNNTPDEWRRAALAMSLLDGVVPYALAPGNHDYGPAGDGSTRDTLMNEYFPFAAQAALPTFGGAFESGKLDNSYHLFTAGGRDYIILALEWGPRNSVIAWANQVMVQHADRYGILVTHAYLNYNDRRYDHTDTAFPQDFNPHQYGTAGGVNDGEELWQKLVRKHRFAFVFTGHVLNDGTGYLASVTDPGITCHQILSNYQFRHLGGEGYMRLMEFLADGRTVRVYTYSPFYDGFLNELDQTFTLTLDLPPPRP